MPLPQVLAGPIVRRVVGNEVAVWMALREPATVELVVWAGPQRSTGPGAVESGTPPVARGTAHDQALRRAAPRRGRRGQGRARSSPLERSTATTCSSAARVCATSASCATRPPRQEATADARPLRLALGYELDRLPSFVTPAPIDQRPRARPGLVPADERRRSRRDGLPRRPHRRAPPGPDAAPATAVPHRRPDLRRRPVGLPAAADQRHRPGAARVHRDPSDRQPRRPGHDRGVPRAAPPQGGPGDRSVLHQRRPAPPALLRRAAGDAPAGVEPVAVAPADDGRRGVRAVRRRSRRTTCRTGRRTTSRSRAIRTPDGLAKWKRTDEPGFTEELKRAESSGPPSPGSPGRWPTPPPT